MAPKEGAVLLRSLDKKFRKILFAADSGPHFQGSRLREGKCLVRQQKTEIEFSGISCRAYPQRGLTAKAGGPLQRRHETGLVRMRAKAMPPATIADPQRRAALAIRCLPRLRSCLPTPFPHPTVPRDGPCYRPPPCTRVSGSLPAGDARSRHRRNNHFASSCRQPELRRLYHRPARGETDGSVFRGMPASRERRRHKGSAFGR